MACPSRHRVRAILSVCPIPMAYLAYLARKSYNLSEKNGRRPVPERENCASPAKLPGLEEKQGVLERTSPDGGHAARGNRQRTKVPKTDIRRPRNARSHKTQNNKIGRSTRRKWPAAVRS